VDARPKLFVIGDEDALGLAGAACRDPHRAPLQRQHVDRPRCRVPGPLFDRELLGTL